jgi:hypothetical protein
MLGTPTEREPINRPLHCHAERSEGSVTLGSEMLRCAQHDRAGIQTNAWIKVFLCIIGPYTYLTLAQLQLFQTPVPDPIQKVTLAHYC